MIYVTTTLWENISNNGRGSKKLCDKYEKHIVNELDKKNDEIKSLQTKNKLLLETVEFYADTNNVNFVHFDGFSREMYQKKNSYEVDDREFSETAREVLKQVKA